jgi:hypothetical protein
MRKKKKKKGEENWNKDENKEDWCGQGSWKVKTNTCGMQEVIFPSAKVQKMVILHYRGS